MLGKGGDLFFGYDYKRYKLLEGTSEDIFRENEKRLKIFLDKEVDSIDYCCSHGIKVLIILEPYINAHHYLPSFTTGFRDENVGDILYECHKIQQDRFLDILISKYIRDKGNVFVLDMRQMFKNLYKEYFYDECHLTGEGNYIKAKFIYDALSAFYH